MTRPGVGFLYLVLVAVGAAAFFAWVATTPELDAAWQITIELESGARGRLDAEERRLVQDILHRHPIFADALIEGRAHGIISPNDRGHVDKKFAYLVRPNEDAPKTIRVSAREDVRVRVRVAGTTAKGEAGPDQPFEFTAPDDGFPQLIELRFPKKRRRNAVQIETLP